MSYTDANDHPGSFFGAGYTATGASTNNIALTTNTSAGTKLLVGLTDAQAAGSTGSTAQVIYALLEMLYTKYAAIAAADRPTKFSIKKGGYTVAASGALRISYTVQVESTSEMVVANE